MAMPSGERVLNSSLIGKENKNITGTVHEKGSLQQQEDEGTSDHFRVEKIIDHKLSKRSNDYEYLVKWFGYGEEDNSWIKASSFDDLHIIKKYWQTKLPKKTAQARSKKK